MSGILTPIQENNPAGEPFLETEEFEDLKSLRADAVQPEIYTGKFALATPKKKDWGQIFENAEKILSEKSKELHIFGYYLEAGLESQGLEKFPALLSEFYQFLEKFWDTMHPKVTPGKNPSAVISNLRWIDNHVSIRLAVQKLSGSSFNTKDNAWDWSNLCRTIKATKDQTFTKSDIQNVLGQLTLEQIQKQESLMTDCVGKIHAINSFLQTKSIYKESSLKKLAEMCMEISRFWNQEVQRRTEEKKVTDQVHEEQNEISQGLKDGNLGGNSVNVAKVRSHIYKELTDLSQQLQAIDPYNPIPVAVKRVLEWQNKSFLEIANELWKLPTATSVIEVLFGKYEPPPKTAPTENAPGHNPFAGMSSDPFSSPRNGPPGMQSRDFRGPPGSSPFDSGPPGSNSPYGNPFGGPDMGGNPYGRGGPGQSRPGRGGPRGSPFGQSPYGGSPYGSGTGGFPPGGPHNFDDFDD